MNPEEGLTCGTCRVRLAQKAIKCSLCYMPYHLRCTGLTEIQIVRLFVARTATYNCSSCVRGEEKYEETLEKVRQIGNEEQKIIESISGTQMNDTITSNDYEEFLETLSERDNLENAQVESNVTNKMQTDPNVTNDVNNFLGFLLFEDKD